MQERMRKKNTKKRRKQEGEKVTDMTPSLLQGLLFRREFITIIFMIHREERFSADII